MDWGQQALFITIVNIILIFSTMIVLWIVSVLKKNMGIVDVGWVLSLFIAALTSFLWGTGDPLRKLLLFGLVSLWTYRLGIHLLTRFLSHPEEDKRYKYLRNKWSSFTELKILAMFLSQGLLALILSLPFMAISFDYEPIGFLDSVGISIALIGILGETVADWQLREFKKNHPDQVCRAGFWNFSRHPNYFFEWVYWIGIALFALQAPFGLTGIISCGLMLIFLLFISGVHPTERELMRSKREAYLKYQREVSGFFPTLN